MADRFMHTILTPSVLEAEEYYYGKSYTTTDVPPPVDPLNDKEKEFIESRDSFYMATITENGWPYLQTRGGPKGFLQVLSRSKVAFCDYGGNRQMVSVGSLNKNKKVSLFMIDYPRRQRLKLLGEVTIYDAREYPGLADQATPPTGHASAPERIFIIDVISYDWNCPKFITPRYTKHEIEELTAPLKQRILELELALKQSPPST